MKKALFALCLLPVFCFGAEISGTHEMCFRQAATKYGVDLRVLKAIAKTESNFTENIKSRPNSNGTYDIGIMQINSSWLPFLSKYGISENSLLRGCTNIHVGAWVLSSNVNRYGNTWKAVGAYNSPTPTNQLRYVQKVYVALREVK